MTTDNTTIACRYHGRDFTTGEMALMRDLIAASPQQTRAGLARAFCRAIGWVKPDGGLRAMAARLTMLNMHRDGIITLPPPRCAPRRLRVPEFGPETDPPVTPMPETLDAVRPIRLVRVTGAGPWPCSASPPPHGRPHPATPSSAGRRKPGSGTSSA